MTKCPECKNLIPLDASFCPNCGKRLKKRSQTAKPKEPQKKNIPSTPKIDLGGGKSEIIEKSSPEKTKSIFAPLKKTIFLEDKEKRTPLFTKVFFIAGAVIIIALLFIGAYLFFQINSFQNLLKIIPDESLFIITFSKDAKNFQNIKDNQQFRELLQNAETAISKNIENAGIDPEKIKNLFKNRTALIFLKSGGKLEPAYFFEIENKKEVINILESFKELVPESYKEVPFYSNKNKKTVFVLDNFLILSNRDLTIKIIESRQNKKTANKKSEIRKISRRLSPASVFLFAYIDLPVLKQYLEGKKLEKYAIILNDLNGAGFTLNGLGVNGIITSNKTSSKMPLFSSNTLKAAPTETIFLVSGADLKENLKPLLESNNIYLNYLTKLVNEKVDIEKDVLSFLQGEFNFFISIKDNAPKYNFIAEISDIETAKNKIENIKKVVEEYFASKKPLQEVKILPDGTKTAYFKMPSDLPQFQQKIFEGIPVFSLKNNENEIAYAFFNKKIFVSSSTESLEKSVSLDKNKNDEFYFVNDPISQNYHFLIYVNPVKISEVFQNLFNNLPEKAKNNIHLISPFAIKTLFSQQGILIEGKLIKPNIVK